MARLHHMAPEGGGARPACLAGCGRGRGLRGLITWLGPAKHLYQFAMARAPMGRDTPARASAGATALLTGAPTAPLAAAFQRRQVGAYPSYVTFLVSARGPQGLFASTACASTEQARMERGVVRQGSVGGAPVPPGKTESGADQAPESHEDGVCHGRLRGLGGAGRAHEHGRHSTLSDLAALVAGLNAARPRRLCLDRAVINTAMRNVLFEASPGEYVPPYGSVAHGILRPYQNVVVTGGIKFLHHAGIPDDRAYLLSSKQAPIFVYGPSTTSRAGGVEVTTRESGFVEPPRGEPECPWGYSLDVRGACNAGGA